MKTKLTYFIKRYGFIMIMFLFTMMIITAPEIPFMSTISEYMVHIMVSSLFLGLLFLILNQDKLMLGALAMCGVLCVFLKNESNTALLRPTTNGNPILSVAHINLSNVTDEYELIGLLNEHNIDVISFQEFTPNWSNILPKVLKNSHPYYSDMVRIDPYGKGVFSKYKIGNVDTIKHANSSDLDIEIMKENQSFHLISSYITPSLDKRSKSLAKFQLNDLVNHIENIKSHKIILGEYNMVYWASEIRKFRTQTGLQNSRRDILPASLKVPYDHIFYTEDLNCLGLNDLTLEDGSRIGVMSSFQYKSSIAPLTGLSKIKTVRQ